MAKRSRNSVSVDVFDRRYVCEFAGTLALVLVGCSAAVIGSPTGALQIGIAFGMTITAVAYAFGAISGAHVNPAVSVAMWAAGRLPARDLPGYIIAQLLGGIAGAALLALVLSVKGGTFVAATGNLAQNGFGPGMFGGYSLIAVVIVEFLATLVFALVILGATRDVKPIAGLVIGLTLVALHLAFLNVDGLSVNPARSFGPAVLVQGNALMQVWVFLLVPTVAGAIAGWLSREKIV